MDEEDNMVIWEYWRRKSAKLDVYVKAFTGGKGHGAPILVESPFDPDELIITMTPDDGEVTTQGFKIPCNQKIHAQAAIQKYLADSRVTMDTRTRVANPREPVRGKRHANSSPQSPAGSRPARQANGRNKRAQRSLT